MKLSIGINGSSRPFLFSKTLKSFNSMVHIRNDVPVIYYEDFVFPKDSNESIKYAKENLRNLHVINGKKKNFGVAIDNVVRSVKSKYMLYIQDDWEFERPIDIDQLIWVMDRNPQINQIMFFKRNVTKFLELHGERILPDEQIQCCFDGVHMCLTNLKWTFIPSIWRMGYARKYWKLYTKKPEPNFKRSLPGKAEDIGCYILGSHGDFRHVRHLGDDYAMEKMTNNKPVKCEVQNTEGKAPWV
jgi:hypothetical protein